MVVIAGCEWFGKYGCCQYKLKSPKNAVRSNMTLQSLSRALCVVLVVGLAQSSQSQSNAPSHERQRGGSAKVEDVSWNVDYDQFKGTNRVRLLLRNISKSDSHFYLGIFFQWNSKEEETVPRFGAEEIRIMFGRADDASDAHPADHEAILLLDKKDRIYLMGDATCQRVGCPNPNLLSKFLSWVIADLASAVTVEGRADGAIFSLSTSHTAAIRDCIGSRGLIESDAVPRWQGKTATQVAQDLEALVNTQGRVAFSGINRYLEEQWHLDYVNNLQLAMTRTRYSHGERLHTVEGSVNWKDLVVLGPYFLECTGNPESQCVSKTVIWEKYQNASGQERETIYGFFSTLGRGGFTYLSYIYYRIMYCDDSIAFNS